MTVSFCSSCGTQVGSTDTSLSWTCLACSHRHHQSPVPVAIAVIPIVNEDTFVGVLGVAHKTQSNAMLLPEGVLDVGEDAVAAAARLVFEHTGLLIDLDDTTIVESCASADGQHLLLSVQFPALSWEVFHTTAEDLNSSERDLVVLDTTTPLEFPIHESIISKICAQFVRPRKHKI